MQMSSRKFENTLRTHRKRSGLSQREVAYLLGWETEAQLSRYERRRVLPRLETVLACQAIFGAPISELFPGPYETIAAAVKRRAQRLASELQTNPGKCHQRLVSHKLQWLVDHCALGNSEINPTHEKVAA